MRPLPIRTEQLSSGPSATPDAILIDIRQDRELLKAIPAVKRRYPSMPVAIVAPSLDPELMLEAMRAGVTEFLPEPLTHHAIESSLGRMMTDRTDAVEGTVLALIGAKGGVGATTLAVNLAEALACSSGSALLLDLHPYGDAAVFVGVEPKFSVSDALENTHRLDAAFFRNLVVHTASGMDLLAAPQSGSTRSLDPMRVRAVVECAKRFYRSVVIDVPRTDASLLQALDAASAFFVVVNHELATVRAAYRLTASLRQHFSDRIGVLVNRTDRASDISLADIEKAVNAKIKHVFPNEYRQALRGLNTGSPVAQSTQTRLGASFHELARKLSGQQPAAAGEEQNRFFGWLTPRRASN